MKLQGEHTFQAPREIVWKTVLDPEVLTNILPGCEDFHQVAENEFEGVLVMKVGPVKGKFQGKVELSDLHEPSSYNLRISGKGAPGFVDGQGVLTLREDGPSRTILGYEIDAKVGGRIASVGQRLLDSSTKVITRQAMEGLEKHVDALSGAVDSGADPSTAKTQIAAPTQEEFAAQMAKGMVEELLPPERLLWSMPLMGIVIILVILAIHMWS
jgi:hypothetical protein